MPSATLTAPAKLNLSLHITGKRADGFHLLQSLVAFTEFGDTLEIQPSAALELSITGPFSAGLSPYDNLVAKAAQALGKKARITLHKNIPVGAGLGGGSSDAAATLMALGTLAEAQKIAPVLGSDVPACLLAQTAWMEGVGEKITPVALKAQVWALLVNPNLPLPTAAVYKHFSGQFSAPCAMPDSMNSFDALIAAIAPHRNDLQEPAISLLPVIGEVLEALAATPGCRLSRMSGSGATCFGLFAKEAEADAAEKTIHAEHPGWWCKASKLRSSQ